MYIVERPETQPSSPYNTAYDFVGSSEEISLFKKNIGSLFLADLKVSGAALETDLDFLIYLARSNRILAMHKRLFESLVDGTEELKEQVVNDLEQTAADGILTKDELSAEMEAIKDFNPSGQTPAVVWLNRNGLSGDFYDGKFEPWALDDEGSDTRTPEIIELMEKLDLTHDSSQYELVRDEHGNPVLPSDREHLSLGALDESGNFTPVLTVLSEDHPVRKAQEQ